MTPEAQDLISKLLVLDPKKRLNVNQIKAHPFFKGKFILECVFMSIILKGIDWENIRKMKAPIIPKYTCNSDTSNFDKTNTKIDEKEKQTPFSNEPNDPEFNINSNLSDGMINLAQFDLTRIDLLQSITEADADKLRY